MLLELPSGPLSVDNVEDAVLHLAAACDAPYASSQSPVTLRPGSRLHAFIIGISRYERHPLRGAASDADAMHACLRDKFNVPDHQITDLRDEEATRDAIIQELTAMRTRRTIDRNDPIVIYFAGYGTSLSPPKAFGWILSWDNPHEKMRAIVPYDSLFNDRAKCVPPILDRTLAVLLSNLMEEKGNNITVIVDCCYSADSETRGASPLRLQRGLDTEEFDAVTGMLDKNILGHRFMVRGALRVAAGFIIDDHLPKPHVFLSAYSAEEDAYEVVTRGEGELSVEGEFTRALLDVLHNLVTDKVTYEQIAQRIKSVSKLRPLCEGVDTDRTLFSSHGYGYGKVAFQIGIDGDRYTLSGGTVQGVADDTEFAVYPSPDYMAGDTPLARMITMKTARPFGADVLYAPSSPTSSLAIGETSSYFAVMTRMGKLAELRLHIGLSEDLVPVMRAVAKDRIRDDSSGPGILLVDETEASLSARATRDGRIEYLIRDSLIREHGIEKLNATTLPTHEDIHPVLVAASRFFWHLRRSPTSSERLEDGPISIEIYSVVNQSLASFWTTSYGRSGEDTVQSGIANVVADGRTPYGITVKNTSHKPLYLWLFYFDCSTLSITEYYGSNAKRPIYPGGQLLIGDGPNEDYQGGLPFVFWVPPGQELDVGLIKTFVTTEDVDLSWIAQASPFEDSGAHCSNVQVRARRSTANDEVAQWSTALITVVQRPGPSWDSE
ncbi:unnamed protein product [Peniophora sp. CBMAI 1063]|nr:unnamed protein product [Peniophora sp. CBMAI 1063]